MLLSFLARSRGRAGVPGDKAPLSIVCGQPELMVGSSNQRARGRSRGLIVGRTAGCDAVMRTADMQACLIELLPIVRGPRGFEWV